MLERKEPLVGVAHRPADLQMLESRVRIAAIVQWHGLLLVANCRGAPAVNHLDHLRLNHFATQSFDKLSQDRSTLGGSTCHGYKS